MPKPPNELAAEHWRRSLRSMDQAIEGLLAAGEMSIESMMAAAGWRRTLLSLIEALESSAADAPPELD